MKYNYKKIFTNDYEKHLLKPANKAIVRATLASWRAAVYATPYITRRLQNGWKVNTGRNVGLIPAMGNYSFPKTPAFTFDLRENNTIQLWNNVPYAYFVDAGVGVNRVPRHMLRIAYQTFDKVLKREFKRLS